MTSQSQSKKLTPNWTRKRKTAKRIKTKKKLKFSLIRLNNLSKYKQSKIQMKNYLLTKNQICRRGTDL